MAVLSALYAIAVVGVRVADVPVIFHGVLLPGYPEWLPTYLVGLMGCVVVASVVTLLYATLGTRYASVLGALGRPLAVLTCLLVVGHGTFLFGFDLAVGQGGALWGLTDVLTLRRVHDPLGATAAGLVGYRVGQLVGLVVMLAWPLSLVVLASQRATARISGRPVPALGVLAVPTVLVCLGAAALIDGSRPPELPRGWNAVNVAPFESRIAFPDSWRVTQGSPPSAVTGVASGSPHANCNLMVLRRSAWTALKDEEQQDALRAEVESSGDSVEPLRELDVSGRPALAWVVDYDDARPEGVVELRQLQTFVLVGENVHQLTCTTYRSTFDERRGVFDEIVAHWKIG